MEKSRNYYNKKFRTSVEFRKPGGTSIYIPVWREVVNVIRTNYAKYDAVLLLEVLEHIDTDLNLLANMANNLLICTVPNFPAVSHVRHFKSLAEVIHRYTPLLNIQHTQQILVKKNTFFLFCGTMRN